MQYTIRDISPAVDAALRRRARATGVSLNRVANDALAEGSGVGRDRRRRDLSGIARTWRHDRAIEAALVEQDVVDEALWR
jgi:hypothetical protein